MLLVDSGALFSPSLSLERPETLEKEFAQSRLLLEGMRRLGYNAVGLGDSDFVYGRERLERLIKESGLAFVSSNIVREDGTPFVNRSLITTVKGLKIGIFSVTAVDTLDAAYRKSNLPGLRLEDPTATAAAMVRELAPQVDLVFCLSHLGTAADVLLARAVPGIDVIFGGHTRQKFAANLTGSTVITNGHFHDTVIGRLELKLVGTSRRKYDPANLDNLRGKLAALEAQQADPKSREQYTRLKEYLDGMSTDGGVFFNGKLTTLNVEVPEDPEMKEFIACGK